MRRSVVWLTKSRSVDLQKGVRWVDVGKKSGPRAQSQGARQTDVLLLNVS